MNSERPNFYKDRSFIKPIEGDTGTFYSVGRLDMTVPEHREFAQKALYEMDLRFVPGVDDFQSNPTAPIIWGCFIPESDFEKWDNLRFHNWETSKLYQSQDHVGELWRGEKVWVESIEQQKEDADILKGKTPSGEEVVESRGQFFERIIECHLSEKDTVQKLAEQVDAGVLFRDRDEQYRTNTTSYAYITEGKEQDFYKEIERYFSSEIAPVNTSLEDLNTAVLLAKNLSLEKENVRRERGIKALFETETKIASLIDREIASRLMYNATDSVVKKLTTGTKEEVTIHELPSDLWLQLPSLGIFLLANSQLKNELSTTRASIRTSSHVRPNSYYSAGPFSDEHAFDFNLKTGVAAINFTLKASRTSKKERDKSLPTHAEYAASLHASFSFEDINLPGWNYQMFKYAGEWYSNELKKHVSFRLSSGLSFLGDRDEILLQSDENRYIERISIFTTLLSLIDQA